MISHLYCKELLGFPQVNLECANGLVVLSGPSGAGKSVLMGSILAGFGLAGAEASLCEIELERPGSMHSELYELDDDLVIRTLKKEKVRYYLNDQNIPKRSLKELFGPYVSYLSVRDKGGFESATLLGLIDRSLMQQQDGYARILKEYKARYAAYREKSEELEQIRADEKKLAELMEFARFEIEKIKSIDPKVGEDEELIQVKRQLSRIDKLNDALAQAQVLLAHEEAVHEVFRLLEKDGGYFTDTMNQLRADFEATEQLSEELAEVDVESVLDRLEGISDLKNRYGSIEEALAHKEAKEKELADYEQIEERHEELESFVRSEHEALTQMADAITLYRHAEAKRLAESMSEYLAKLKLPPASFLFEAETLSATGKDRIDLALEGSTTATLSGGEHNRLRLALMAVALEGSKEGGVIILDEIDANVSGDESIAIAQLLAKLAQTYQIFAVSHQPHLAAQAHQHILIARNGDHSEATELDEAGRIREISRIVGGEMPGDEAVAFAKRLRNQ